MCFKRFGNLTGDSGDESDGAPDEDKAPTPSAKAVAQPAKPSAKSVPWGMPRVFTINFTSFYDEWCSDRKFPSNLCTFSISIFSKIWGHQRESFQHLSQRINCTNHGRHILKNCEPFLPYQTGVKLP